MGILMIIIHENALSVKQQELLTAARRAASEETYNCYPESSICPYPSHSVLKAGAAVRFADGAIMRGENPSMPNHMCAERAVIAEVRDKREKIESIAVYTLVGDIPFKFIGNDRDEQILSYGMPCGTCRQALVELAQASGRKIDYVCAVNTTPFVVSGSVSDLLQMPYLPPKLK
ncbi:Uncharacterised protein [uncultured archaeon]|nr:Uncharacterised protein [uncultured archaeon]